MEVEVVDRTTLNTKESVVVYRLLVNSTEEEIATELASQKRDVYKRQEVTMNGYFQQ